jgi:hypothetical protein
MVICLVHRDYCNELCFAYTYVIAAGEKLPALKEMVPTKRMDD